mmetsp:Transcript_48676/g.95162  ORF Transcript_48676/g.95162 Transcript_48676/m.95162 type:complete len:251 (+) Transcript_48676:405-1157(+)
MPFQIQEEESGGGVGRRRNRHHAAVAAAAARPHSQPPAPLVHDQTRELPRADPRAVLRGRRRRKGGLGRPRRRAAPLRLCIHQSVGLRELFFRHPGGVDNTGMEGRGVVVVLGTDDYRAARDRLQRSRFRHPRDGHAGRGGGGECGRRRRCRRRRVWHRERGCPAVARAGEPRDGALVRFLQHHPAAGRAALPRLRPLRGGVRPPLSVDGDVCREKEYEIFYDFQYHLDHLPAVCDRICPCRARPARRDQ